MRSIQKEQNQFTAQVSNTLFFALAGISLVKYEVDQFTPSQLPSDCAPSTAHVTLTSNPDTKSPDANIILPPNCVLTDDQITQACTTAGKPSDWLNCQNSLHDGMLTFALDAQGRMRFGDEQQGTHNPYVLEANLQQSQLEYVPSWTDYESMFKEYSQLGGILIGTVASLAIVAKISNSLIQKFFTKDVPTSNKPQKLLSDANTMVDELAIEEPYTPRPLRSDIDQAVRSQLLTQQEMELNILVEQGKLTEEQARARLKTMPYFDREVDLGSPEYISRDPRELLVFPESR